MYFPTHHTVENSILQQGHSTCLDKPLPIEETPSAVHAALKHRVECIIQEAMTLPNLKVRYHNWLH